MPNGKVRLEILTLHSKTSFDVSLPKRILLHGSPLLSCNTFIMINCIENIPTYILRIYFEDEYYLTPAIASANNVLPQEVHEIKILLLKSYLSI